MEVLLGGLLFVYLDDIKNVKREKHGMFYRCICKEVDKIRVCTVVKRGLIPGIIGILAEHSVILPDKVAHIQSFRNH